MSAVIYDKTDKGREEIATRRYGLPNRLRTLLLLMDGKQPADTVLARLSGVGLLPLHVEQLCEAGFLQEIEVASQQPEPGPDLEPQPLAETLSIADLLNDTDGDADDCTMPTETLQLEPGGPANQMLATEPDVPEELPHEELPHIPTLGPELSPIQKLYQFYTETIDAAVGLRGYSLQLKVEGAASVEDFARLREEYLQTMTRAKSRNYAAVLEENLDLLLRHSTQLPDAA